MEPTSVDLSQAIALLREKMANDFDIKGPIVSVYLYGSYVRGDFVPKRSDLDFAVILDLPEAQPHWDHPSFKEIISLLRTIFLPFLPNNDRFFTIDVVSFSLAEVERGATQMLKPTVGPHKLLTFLAFDFLNNNCLLWGADVLQCFQEVPDPDQFAQSRKEWIRTRFQQNRVPTKGLKENLLMSLGALIQYKAVLDGVRDIRKSSLRSWVLEKHEQMFKTFSKDLFTQYFSFITGESDNAPIHNPQWVAEVEELVERRLGEQED